MLSSIFNNEIHFLNKQVYFTIGEFADHDTLPTHPSPHLHANNGWNTWINSFLCFIWPYAIFNILKSYNKASIVVFIVQACQIHRYVQLVK